MKILISNDDGIAAPGLSALYEALIPSNEVYVVAPTHERSAMGHALTLHRPLRVENVPKGYFPDAKVVCAVDGTPTDCVKIALTSILDFKPDWVLSGINNGPNMSADIMYSGTVSIAIEGAIYGIKSVAFSSADYREQGHKEAAKAAMHVLSYVDSIGDLDQENGSLFNVNIPSGPFEEMRGIALTRLGARMYRDTYEERIDPRGKRYYWLSGDLLSQDPDPYSDVSKTSEGYISLTPLDLEMTNRELLQKMQKKTSKSLMSPSWTETSPNSLV